MPRLLPAAFVAFLSAAVVLVPLVTAAQQQVTLAPGDTLTVNCSTTLTGTVSNKSAQLSCAAPAATPTPTPKPGTPPPPSASTGICGESNHVWHGPVVNNCATKHEHGDAPPAWVNGSAYKPMFTHAGNTPSENQLKHTSFKGFEARFNNVDVYVIMHLDTNPSGHSSRFHSYQMWARDGSGGVSYFDGWMDFGLGDSTGPRILRHGCDDVNLRPAMIVNTESCSTKTFFENWYANPAGFGNIGRWMPDLGFNTSPNYYTGGDPANPATWVSTDGTNATRRFEAAWYPDRSAQRGRFFGTNFGQVVSGPTDPVCSTTRTVGGKSYPVLCIEQFIAPTLTRIGFPGNAEQKTYDMTGVTNPN